MFKWHAFFLGITMPRDDSKDEHIHIVVREGQKARWTDHVENNPNYDSLSDFMRDAAENLYATDIQGGDVPDEVDRMKDEILIQMEQMASTLQLLNENLENVRENQIGEEMMDDIVAGYANAIERQIESLNESTEDDSDE